MQINLLSAFKKIPRFIELTLTAKENNIKIWLLGGFLRDLTINKQSDFFDFDFCLDKNPLNFVKKFSTKIKAKYIVLDKKEQTYRIILKEKGNLYTYDFSPLRGKTLRQDLLLRDFTINALAVDLSQKPYLIIDELKAFSDVKKKTIRAISGKALKDDPLRILRAFAFSLRLGFKIDKATLALIKKYKKLLVHVSKERINEELFKILKYNKSFEIIKTMDELKVLDVFIPSIKKARGVIQGGYHHLDVWNHSLETLRQYELIFRQRLSKSKDLADILEEELAYNRSRNQIIKLACLIHDLGKPKAKKNKNKKTIFYTHEKIGAKLAELIAKDLRLSLKESDVLKKLVLWHLRPGFLADQISPSKKAVYHFFRDTDPEGAAVIILSLSDWRATRGPLTSQYRRRRHQKIMLNLLQAHIEDSKKKPLPKLLNGHTLMNNFKLSSGPFIGEILKKIGEAQSLGIIRKKEQALKMAGDMIKKKYNSITVTKKARRK